MRTYWFNVAVQWFGIGLLAGVVIGAGVAACESQPNNVSPAYQEPVRAR